MTGSTSNAETSNPVIKEWTHHRSMTRQLAARIAQELALRPDHSRVESSMRLARRHGTSSAMAANARHLLMGAGLIYKSGRHYYKAAPPIKETETADDRERGAGERL